MTVKIVLLAVTGLTPQVITETLYALYQQAQVMPEQIHILTTADGYQRAKLTLINDGWLQRFYDDYALPMPEFTEQHIHILQQANSEPLVDIRTQADNQAMADAITEWIRCLTADPETALHISITGGRKTMSFYAGYALSLYGRVQDRLSHVLVSAEYESHPEFFYPTPYSKVIYGNDRTRKPLDTQNAQVMIADIPFVRLRHGLDAALLQGQSSFSQTVAKAQLALGPAQLSIDLKQCCVKAHDTVIKLTPADLAFYSWFIKRQLTQQVLLTCPNEGAPELEYAEQYLVEYRLIKGELGATDRTLNTLQIGMSKAFFEQRKSRINKLLQQTLAQASRSYLISAVGKRPLTRYQISLKTDQIHYIKST
jgi:CRISPR-associated protein (TIGR02584 family)